jgi:hypothetical protein
MDPDFRRGGRIRADYIVTEANAAEIAKLDKTRVIGPSRRLVRTGQPHQPDQTEKAQPTPTTMLVIAALDRIGGGSRAGALCVSETDTSNNLRASFGNEACGPRFARNRRFRPSDTDLVSQRLFARTGPNVPNQGGTSTPSITPKREEESMKAAITIGMGLALVMATATTANAWRGAVGPRGGAAVAGPRGAAVRGPGGNVAVSRTYGGYYGGRYGAGAVTAGVAVGAAAGAAAASTYNSCYPYNCAYPCY